MHLHSGFVNQADGKLFYQAASNINAKPIIFLHGFPFTGSMWQDIALALPEEFRPIIPDLRNHGLDVHQSNI